MLGRRAFEKVKQTACRLRPQPATSLADPPRPIRAPVETDRVWVKTPPENQTPVASGSTSSWWVWDANDTSVVGRFKTVAPEYPSTAIYSIGMERVAYALAADLGLPVPAVHLATLDGLAGCIMLRAGGDNALPYEWAIHRSAMLANVQNEGCWPLAVAFDVLIANVDRSEKNIVVDPVPPDRRPALASECVTWLIDHEKSGLWWPAKIDAAAELDPDVLVVTTGEMQKIGNDWLKGFMPAAYRRSFESLSARHREPVLEIIRAIPDDRLESAVMEVPAPFMTNRSKELTLAFLTARRERIATLTSDVFPPP